MSETLVDPEVHAQAATALSDLLDELILEPHEFVPRIPLPIQLAEIKITSAQKAKIRSAVRLFACQGATFGAAEHERARAELEECARLGGKNTSDAIFT